MVDSHTIRDCKLSIDGIPVSVVVVTYTHGAVLPIGLGYDNVIEATPKTLLKLLEDSLHPGRCPVAFASYVRRNILRMPVNLYNHWKSTVEPFVDTSLEWLICDMAHRRQMDTITVNVQEPYAFHFNGWKLSLATADAKLDNLISQCVAYNILNIPSRGGDCGRWGTRLAPEGFNHVMSNVLSKGGWKVCALPPNAFRCVMVVMRGGVTWFFKINGGSVLHDTPQSIDADTCDDGTVPSAFECTYNALTGEVVVYDCMIAGGMDIRHQTLSHRISRAEYVTFAWRVENRPVGHRKVKVARYLPSNSDHETLDIKTVQLALFVRDKAPLGTFAGGDAFVWKAPSLTPKQSVMMCRDGKCFALERKNHYLLREVGEVRDTTDEMQIPRARMTVCVCERFPRTNVWTVIRPARRCERVFTYEECVCTLDPHAQLSRDDLSKMLSLVVKTGDGRAVDGGEQ